MRARSASTPAERSRRLVEWLAQVPAWPSHQPENTSVDFETFTFYKNLSLRHIDFSHFITSCQKIFPNICESLVKENEYLHCFVFFSNKYLDENCIDESSELYKCVSGITQLNLIAWNTVFRSLE